MTHRIYSTPNRPALEVLPMDPTTQKHQEIGRLNRRPACEVVEGQLAQLRVLLRDGPLGMPEVGTALKVRENVARWLIRRLRLADEIVPTDGRRWKLKAKVSA